MRDWGWAGSTTAEVLVLVLGRKFGWNWEASPSYMGAIAEEASPSYMGAIAEVVRVTHVLERLAWVVSCWLGW